MTISLFTDGIFPLVMGGMQKHSYYLTKYLAQNKVHLDVYFGATDDSTIAQLTPHFTADELKYIHFCRVGLPKTYKFPGHYLWENYQYSKEVYKAYKKSKPTDFIYLQGFAGWYYLKKRDSNSPPTGINFHGLNMFQKAPSFAEKINQQLFKPFVKWNLKKAEVLFSLGGGLTDILKKVAYNKNIVEIPIGISDDWLLSQLPVNEAKSLKFIFIGRYDRVKGVEELNKVLQELLKESTTPFEMHFIGPIPVQKQLKGFPQVIYHGAIHNEVKIQQLLKESDVLLSPSWSEGMPTVILEAMASGCAIIATHVGAVSEQVNSNNGYLIPPGSPQALKNAINTILQLPHKQLTAMKKTSIKRVKEKFLWQKVANKTVKEIANIINSGK